MRLLGACVAALCLSSTSSAWAQLEESPTAVHIGDWTIEPTVALRLRGEYRRSPVDLGGDVYSRTAVQADGYQSAAPTVLARVAPAYDLFLLSERARLGVTVSYSKVRAVITLQDARVFGVLPGAAPGVGRPATGSFEPHEAYLAVRSANRRPTLELRLGRQEMTWGDGRLLGANDHQPRGGALDAARLLFHIGDALDLQLLGAMLAFPGPIPPRYADHAARTTFDADDSPSDPEGTGAQLYGADATLGLFPLLNLEVTGLARIARDPLPAELVRGDTYTVDGRIFGAYRGVSFAAEGAYQLGRVAGFGVNRDIAALALAGDFAWQTALPGSLRLAAFGAYASGDDSGGKGDKLARFDPILPDVHRHHGMMDLYSWSNLIEAGASVGLKPHDEVDIDAGYALAGLAEPSDRWSTGTLTAVGAAPGNEAFLLGHELDVRIGYQPFDGVRFEAGYGMFILGDGGKAILSAAGRGDPSLLHYGLLQASLQAP